MRSPQATSGYAAFLAEVKGRIQSARLAAGRAVNRELLLLYWDIGRGIVDRQRTLGWGDSVVTQFASDLRAAYPGMQGFSDNSVWLMRQFYLEYSSPDFLEQAVQELAKMDTRANLEQPVQENAPARRRGKKASAEVGQKVMDLVGAVPWGHHVEILKKVKIPAARLYYLRATAQCGWSRRILMNQIKARTWERAVKERKTHNFALALPGDFAEQADEALKSRYNLEFLGIARPLRERALEDLLVSRLQQFLLELGYGFCFVGRQYRLALGAKEYFVDLLFYHRFLKTLVAFDLKIGEFEPEHAGKMDFYLNLLNEKERGPGDRPCIGIILCAEKDDVEVEFALGTKTNPIGVAGYQLHSTLPPEFKGKLPSSRQLTNAILQILPGKKPPRKKEKTC